MSTSRRRRENASAQAVRDGRSLPPRARLASAIGALSETDRVVLSLYLLESMSVPEIAGALKLTAPEVEQRRVSALASIARQLGTPRTRGRAA